MLFIVTNSEDATASFLAERLSNAGVALVRLDTDSIVGLSQVRYRIADPVFEIDGRSFRPSDVTNVWYRRPEQLRHVAFDGSPEAEYTRKEWTESIEGFFAHVRYERWINHPGSNAAASHKLEQLTRALQLGFSVPATIVTQEPKELREFFTRHDGRIIAKPIGNGHVKRPADEADSLIYTNIVKSNELDALDDLRSCPTMFQQYIQKAMDVRVTVVDSDIHSIGIVARDNHGSQRCDIRRNNMSDVTYEPIQLPSEIAAGVKKLMRHYRLRFAALDFAVASSGQWYFFEVNPNGQWAWLDIGGHTKISASFIKSFREQD